MKLKVVILVGLYLTSCAVGGQNKTKNSSEIDIPNAKLKSAKGEIVAFYNVENLFDTIDNQYTIDEQFLPSAEGEWTSERYQTKLNNLGKVIASMKKGSFPIFIGLAEVENKEVVENLANDQSIKGAGYKVVHEESPDQRGIDLGFMYRRDYFLYISHQAVEVKLEDEPDFYTRDILYVKGVLKGNDTLHIFLNHWPSRREGEKESEYKREKAASVLRAKVDELLSLNKAAKIIIMGDFNDYPENGSIVNILKAKETPNYEAAELLNTAYRLEKQNLGTYNYKGDWGMLDQIILSEGIVKATKGVKIIDNTCTIHRLDWMVFKDPKYGDEKPSKTYGGSEYYGGYSDHLPVYITLE